MLKKYITVLIVAAIGALAYFAISHDIEVREKQQVVKQERTKQLHCLAQNIYHEARGESADGQKAVAQCRSCSCSDNEQDKPS